MSLDTTKEVNSKVEFTAKHIEDFKKYVKVQKSGKYNMITDMVDASEEAGLILNEYIFVINHYKELAELAGV